MANYYVSATTGNDSNNGTSVATAKATIGAGENLATSAGDIVHIAPGNYREQVSHGYSGTAASRIYFIGDPDCEIFTDVTPGVVRITRAADSRELAAANSGTSTGPVVKTNGRDYITWKNVHVDGNSGGVSAYNDTNTSYGFYASTQSDFLETINCMTQSTRYGFYNVRYVKDCVAWGHQSGFYFCRNVDSSLAFGCFYGAQQCTLVVNSIVHGNWSAAYNNNQVINCLIFGGYYATLGASNGDFVFDSLFFGNRHAVGAFSTSDTSQIIVSGSYVASAYLLNRYGKIHATSFGHLQIDQWSNTPVRGIQGSSNMVSDGLAFEQRGMTLWSMNDARKIIHGFKPTLFSKAIQGATVSDEPDGTHAALLRRNFYDILGNPRLMDTTGSSVYEQEHISYTSSSRDIGPFEFSNVQVTSSFNTSSAGFAIEGEGIFRVPISISGSDTMTASIDVKHINNSVTAVKPQFVLKYSEHYPTASATAMFTTTAANKMLSGSELYLQTETSTADNNVYTTLTVSHSAVKSRELELLCINQQTGSATSSFSDLVIV